MFPKKLVFPEPRGSFFQGAVFPQGFLGNEGARPQGGPGPGPGPEILVPAPGAIYMKPWDLGAWTLYMTLFCSYYSFVCHYCGPGSPLGRQIQPLPCQTQQQGQPSKPSQRYHMQPWTSAKAASDIFSHRTNHPWPGTRESWLLKLLDNVGRS